MSNPYKGPLPFERADRHRFYGRNREVEELLDLLMAERIVLLYSPSGAGKSSLLAAGLIPRLEEEHFRPLPVLRVSRRPPSEWSDAVAAANRYVLSLLLYLEEGLPPETPRLSPAELGRLKLAEYLKQRHDFADATQTQVLIFDQFEEVLTLRPADQLGPPGSMTLRQRERLFDSDRDAKEEFFTQVGAALRNRRRWALFALREDYVAGLDPYLAAVPTRLANTYRLDLLDRDEALQAVRRPAAAEGVEFTPAAAEKLVDDLRQMRVMGPAGLVQVPGPHVEPVQLQVVCLGLWEKLSPERGRTIDVGDLDVLGDVDTALMGYYDRKVAEVAAASGERERTIRDWFDRYLITVQGRRGQVLQGDPSQIVPDAVAAELVNAHLVREDKRAGATWFELAHDRLIDPVRKSNDAWSKVHLPPLQRMAPIWDAKGRPLDNFLLRHQELEEAEAWAAKNADAINDVDRAFLQACRDHRTRGEERRNRERAARYRMITLIGGLVAVVVIVTLSVLIAWALRKELSAQDAQKDAEHKEGRAGRRLTMIQSEQLARAARDVENVNPEFGVFLALKGLKSLDPIAPGEDAADERNVARARMFLRSALNRCVQRSRVKFTLLGHTDEVNALAYSPDGERIATASDDGTARLWDANTGKLLRTFGTPGGVSINAVAFHPASNLLATAGDDKSVRLWRLPGGEHDPKADVLMHDGKVNAVAFSPDGKLLAAGTAKGRVFLWSVASRVKQRDWFGHEKSINALAFNPTVANRLVTASDDRTVKVWYPDTGAKRRELPHGAAVTALAFKPDGKRLATASDDGSVRVWYAENERGQPRWMPLSGIRGVVSLAFHPNDQLSWLAAGRRDAQVSVWEGSSNRAVFSLPGHQKLVTGVAFRPGSSRELATSSEDHTVKVWDLSSQEQLHLQPRPARPYAGVPNLVAFSATGKFVAAGSNGWDNWVKVWDRATGKETINGPAGHRLPIRAVAFSGDGKRLLTGSEDMTARIWDTGSGRERVTLAGHTRPVWGVASSRAGNRVATASQDGTARVWDSESGNQLLSLPHLAPRWPLAVAFSEDGQRLATAASDGVAHIWDVNTGTELHSLTGHTDAVTSVAFSPDGQRLLTGSSDGTARIWDLVGEPCKELLKLEFGHPGPPGGGRLPPGSNSVGVAYSPDGKWAATCASWDRVVRVWDAGDGKQARVLEGHSAYVWGVAFSPDGKWVASASGDRTARVWEVASGKVVQTLAGHTGSLYGLAFQRAGGSLLATASEDRTTRLWDTARRGTLVRVLQGQAATLRRLAVSEDGKTLAVVRFGVNPLLFDEDPAHEPRELSSQLDEFWLPTPWHLGVLRTLALRSDHTTRVTSIAFSPDGSRAVTGSWDQSAKLWEVKTGRLLRTYAGENGHDRAVTAVAFSPDAESLATGSQDGTVKLWEVKSGGYRFDLLGRDKLGERRKDRHTNTILALAFHPRRKYLATASQDGTVKIWDVSSEQASHRQPRMLPGQSGVAYTLVFSPKGKRLAVVQSTFIKVWDIEDIDNIKQFFEMGEVPVFANLLSNPIAFKDDKHLLAIDVYRRVREYWFDLEELRKVAARRISPPSQQAHMEKEKKQILDGD